MAQLVVRNLEQDVKTRLQRRAKARGHSMEEEVREILREAVVPERNEKGFGTQLAEIFANVPPEFKIPPRGRELPRAAKFKR